MLRKNWNADLALSYCLLWGLGAVQSTWPTRLCNAKRLVYNSSTLSKVKYIVGAAVLAGLIGSGYFNADPVVFSPSLIDRCRMTSNDNAAIANLRTIVTAEFTYRAMTTTYGAIENLVVTGLLEERYKA